MTAEIDADASDRQDDSKKLEVQQSNAVPDQSKEVTRSELMTRVLLKPEYNAAIASADFLDDGETAEIQLFDMCTYLTEESQKVQSGDLSRMESMLTAQAHVLNEIFTSMAKRAAKNMKAGFPQAADTYLRLSLKAQGQCRTTIETLGELKYPKSATFIKQANIANQQQVNNGQPSNGASTPAPARAEEKDVTPANKLLTEAGHASLDTRGAGATGGINQNMEAVGVRHRSKKRGG